MVDATSAFNSTSFIVDLFILLSAAVIAGEVANRFGQAALVGQLVVGVVLGPTILGPYIGLTSLGSGLTALQVLATVFILFMAGLDIVPEQIYRMGFATAAMGIAVFAVPFALLSVAAAVLFTGLPPLTPLFIGLTLSITALPVMGIMLVEFGLTKTRMGNLLIRTALVNELAAVTVFAVLLQLQAGTRSSWLAIVLAVLSIAVFLGVMLSIHFALRSFGESRWGRATRSRVADGWRSKEAGFAILMVAMIGASLFSQYMGLTFVVGAFYAGIIVTEETAGPRAHEAASRVFDAMTWGFFIPLFFAFVGVEMDLRLLSTPWIIFVFMVLLLVAIVTKVATGFTVARFFSWPKADALAIGHLVNSRGAVELAMAVLLLEDGVFSIQLFTIVAGIGLVTTFLAPIGAGWAWRSNARGASEPGSRAREPRERGIRPYQPTLSFGIVQQGVLSDVPWDGGGQPPPNEGEPTARSSTPSSGSGRPPLPTVRKR